MRAMHFTSEFAALVTLANCIRKCANKYALHKHTHAYINTYRCRGIVAARHKCLQFRVQCAVYACAAAVCAFCIFTHIFTAFTCCASAVINCAAFLRVFVAFFVALSLSHQIRTFLPLLF